MKKYFKNSVWILIIISFLILPLFSFATFVCPPDITISECQKLKLNEVYGNSYGADKATSVESKTISNKIGIILSYVLTFLGVIFLVLTVYSGFQWMTAGGNEEKITKARTRLINATLGLAIILAAFAITNFVVSKLQNTISGTASGTNEFCLNLTVPEGFKARCLSSCDNENNTEPLPNICEYSTQDDPMYCCKVPN